MPIIYNPVTKKQLTKALVGQSIVSVKTKNEENDNDHWDEETLTNVDSITLGNGTVISFGVVATESGYLVVAGLKKKSAKKKAKKK